MRNIILAVLFILVILSCTSSKNIVIADGTTIATKTSDTVKIANDSLEYEVIIIDPGFSSWLSGYAKPRGFYSESYLENKNLFWSIEWNSRYNQPQRYGRNMYEMRIDYDRSIHYGYEVNYLIYNYLVYFQITNNQKLGGFVPSP